SRCQPVPRSCWRRMASSQGSKPGSVSVSGPSAPLPAYSPITVTATTTRWCSSWLHGMAGPLHQDLETRPASDYEAALRRYVSDGSEEALLSAYSIGRQ